MSGRRRRLCSNIAAEGIWDRRSAYIRAIPRVELEVRQRPIAPPAPPAPQHRPASGSVQGGRRATPASIAPSPVSYFALENFLR